MAHRRLLPPALSLLVGTSLGAGLAVGSGPPAASSLEPLVVTLRHSMGDTLDVDAAVATAQDDGECTVTGSDRGPDVGERVVVDVGQRMEVDWSKDRGRYVATNLEPEGDLRWQPVSVWTEGDRSAGLVSHRALRFPEPPLLIDTAETWGGGQVVRYAPPDVREHAHVYVEVDLPGGGHLRCPGQSGVVVLPPGTAAALGAPAWLVSARRLVERAGGGRAVVGEAVQRVRVDGTSGTATERLTLATRRRTP